MVKAANAGVLSDAGTNGVRRRSPTLGLRGKRANGRGSDAAAVGLDWLAPADEDEDVGARRKLENPRKTMDNAEGGKRMNGCWMNGCWRYGCRRFGCSGSSRWWGGHGRCVEMWIRKWSMLSGEK